MWITFLPIWRPHERTLEFCPLPALGGASAQPWPSASPVVRRRAQGPKLGQLREDVRLLQALCLAWWRGEYRAISPKALVTVVAGLLYFVSPLDAIPDWLVGVGFLDDIAVLGWVLKTVADELNRFKAWRDSQAPERLRVVERLPDSPESLRTERRAPEDGTGFLA